MEQENKTKNPINGRLMRQLHRDIGYFMIGLTFMFSFSGMTLIFRDTNFLKSETHIEKVLKPGLDEQQLGQSLRLRGFQVTKIDAQAIHFKNGVYDKTSGQVSYSSMEYPALLRAMTDLHKTASKSSARYWFTVLYGCGLAFLAFSALWMYRPGTRLFKRGIFFFSAGLGLTVLLVWLA